MTQEELNDFLLNKAKIWLNSGEIFGINGEGICAEYRLSKKCAETGNGTVESCTG